MGSKGAKYSVSKCLLPWNIRCSKRWAKPVFPLGSCPEPTMYTISVATIGAEGSGLRTTVSPLSSLYSMDGSLGIGLTAAGELELAGAGKDVSATLGEGVKRAPSSAKAT